MFYPDEVAFVRVRHLRDTTFCLRRMAGGRFDCYAPNPPKDFRTASTLTWLCGSVVGATDDLFAA